ncbi:TlpA disulfide reductase family protein [Humitalea sp. 24SJ18S-53]|uniref:TlpA disulfide reductase family protein n=1 Tax=Humitalea sp. 24SJ18S-53 TaxID=3422307 RepID=UPI003D673CE2
MTRRQSMMAPAMLTVGGTLTMGGGLRPASAAERDGFEALVETPPRALPEGLAWTDGEGAASGPAAFAGRGMVINLWATWCAPCVAEMPALDRLAALLAPQGIVVLPLSSDRGGRAQVAPFYERTRLRNLGIWLDPRGTVGRAFSVRGLPTTIIVGRDGRERARLEGAAAWDSPRLVAAVRRLAGAEAPANTST